MKTFFLIASLSFASAIMLVPHNGNETRSSVHDALLPTNDTSHNLTNHMNFTNDINMKHRPHLAVIQSRKLLEDGGDQETEDAIEYASEDENQDAKEDAGNNRKLLISLSKIFRRSSPPPPPPPPPPKPAPVPAPAPKAVTPPPPPKPAPVPAPAPKAVTPPPPPKPAPAPAPKAVTPPPTPKPAPAPKAVTPPPPPKPAPVPAPKVASSSPPAPAHAPKVVVVLPPPVSKNFPIFMTCDNEFDLYVNGEKVGKGDVWTKTYEFNPKVNDGDVIAIDGVDKGGPAAFIGVFNGKITKPNEWKCTTKKSDNWNKNNFDDSSWSYATSYGKNKDQNIWMSVGRGSRPNIPGDAEWLWTNNNENHDRVYCRFFYNKPSVVYSSPAKVVNTVAPVSPPVVVVKSDPTPKAVVQPTVQPSAKPVVQPSAPVVVQPSAPTPANQVVQPSAPVVVQQPANPVVQPSAPVVVQPPAPTPANPVVQPATSTKQCEPFVFPPTSHSVIKEQVGELSNEAKKKMDELISKFNGMVADIKTKNTKQLESDGKLVKETEVKSSDLYTKYTSEFTKTEQLMFNIDKLNVTLHRHLKVIQAESDYLAKLKVFKPKFLTSLDKLKDHTSSIKKDIHQTIVEGNDKNGLISILDDIRSSTEKSASLLSKAFMDHYDKYNKQLDQNNDMYKNEQKTMTNLNTEYQVAKTKKNSLLNDYNEIVHISKKLKETYATSQKDQALFEEFMGKIDKLFKQNENNVIQDYTKLSTSNTACATDVLKSHIENKRV